MALPEPITRLEKYWKAILDKIQGGGSSVTVEPLTVTQNGTTTAPSGTAYSPVTTNVPNSYGASDEGKVVNNGALVAQTAHAPVTANGTIDTTLYNSVPVNVPNPNYVETVTGTLGDPFGELEYADLISGLVDNSITIIMRHGSYTLYGYRLRNNIINFEGALFSQETSMSYALDYSYNGGNVRHLWAYNGSEYVTPDQTDTTTLTVIHHPMPSA